MRGVHHLGRKQQNRSAHGDDFLIVGNIRYHSGDIYVHFKERVAVQPLRKHRHIVCCLSVGIDQIIPEQIVLPAEFILLYFHARQMGRLIGIPPVGNVRLKILLKCVFHIYYITNQKVKVEIDS